MTRKPALLMKVRLARSNTNSLTGPASKVASWASNSGAVAVSRLPESLIVAVCAASALRPVSVWITSGIIPFLFGFILFSGFEPPTGRFIEMFDQKQNVFIPLPAIPNRVGVAAHDRDAPSSDWLVVLRACA